MTMDIGRIKTVCVTIILLIALFAGGCGEPVQRGKGELAAEIALGTTIGSVAEVFLLESIPVEGHGLVGELRGTGSSECPPQVRTYLEQYILTQSPELDIDKLIGSQDTAVVLLEGIMPTAVPKNQHFDIKASALLGTQTTSLEGGQLYGAELRSAGRFAISTRVLAKAGGPVFIDTLSGPETNKREGYILAGGRVLDEYKINLAIRRPDYRVAGSIRDKLNERFGSGTAKAVSDGLVELKVPPEYQEQKQKFASIVRSMYLNQTEEVIKERIRTFVRRLAVSEDKYESEIALEAIGNESLSKLAALLQLSDEQVRLGAGRCMLNLGSDEGLEALRQIAMDKDSLYRVEALEAITQAARRSDATAISRRLLRNDDFDIRLAAYEQLRKLDDIAITQRVIARSFYLEQITQTEHKGIFVSRSGQPRIVIFGAPIYIRDNIFVQSTDGNITINAPAGQKYVSIIRKHPTRPNVAPIKLKSSFELGDIIRTLCEEPLKRTAQERRGLGVSYAEAIALLKQLSEKGAVQAEFRAGPLPKIDVIIKK
ncbi:MAG: flagellar basal body P-ring protein FlgI [Planctomycetota bacterium]|jgi:flagellar basal body P-ring protein FlgI